MFPAGFWSRESVRRFALQVEGERGASACPPLTARSRRPKTNPLATDGRSAVLGMTIFPLSSLLILHTTATYESRRAAERRAGSGSQSPTIGQKFTKAAECVLIVPPAITAPLSWP